MQFSSIVAIISLAATSVVAAPSYHQSEKSTGADKAAPAPAATPAPLSDFWEDKDFLGIKLTGKANIGECKNFPQEFNNIFSSAKARAGLRCTVWVKKDCEGTGFSYNEKPGAPKFPDWIDNKASSWKCVKNDI